MVPNVLPPMLRIRFGESGIGGDAGRCRIITKISDYDEC